MSVKRRWVNHENLNLLTRERANKVLSVKVYCDNYRFKNCFSEKYFLCSGENKEQPRHQTIYTHKKENIC